MIERMKKLRFPKMIQETVRGWTQWVYPTQGFLFKCCDCGLVHEMQFKPFVEKNNKRGTFEVVPLPEPIRVAFRVRRVRGG